jgi:hypothetical protein
MPKRSSKAGNGPREVVEAPTPTSEGVDEQGAFAYASCPVCGWRGAGRRARARARKDHKHQQAEVDGHPATDADASN